MMRISKIDSVDIHPAKGLEENPLSTVELLLDLVFADPSALNKNQSVELSCDDVAKAIDAAYQGKFLNFGEQMPMVLFKGTVIIKTTVSRFESLVNKNQSYGNVTADTLFRCSVVDKAKQKIKMTDSVLEKK